MSFQICIDPDGSVFKCLAHQTILQAALAAGILFPHGCRAGQCGRCKSLLTRGTYRYIGATPAGITTAEREQGYLLCCQAKALSDITLKWAAAPLFEVSTARAEILALNQSHLVVTLRLLQPGSLLVTRGQQVLVHADIGDCTRATIIDAIETQNRLILRLERDHCAARFKLGDIVSIEGPY